MDFVIDTVGDESLVVKNELIDEAQRSYKTDVDEKTKKILELCSIKCTQLDDKLRCKEELEDKLSHLKIDQQFDEFFEEHGWSKEPGVPSIKVKNKKRITFHFENLDLETGKLKSNLGAVNVAKEMENIVLKPGIEKEFSLPQYDPSEKKLKAIRKHERQKSKGPQWFGMKAPEMTDDLKNDLQVLKMRSALDPKHFYKKNDMAQLPKYFQVGRVMDSPLDHVNERLTNKQRKRTMVDELLADAEFHKYNKKKYKEIIEQKKKKEYRTHMREKRQKWKNTTKDKKEKTKSKN